MYRQRKRDWTPFDKTFAAQEGNFMTEIRKNTLTAAEFHALYTSVGWDAPAMEQIEVALTHSAAVFAVYDTACNRPVGMARLIGDGGMSFYIKDFAVLPEYQHCCIGSLLMHAVKDHIRAVIADGWAVSLECISTPGAVPFYEKHGFEPRPNVRDGPGMMQMLCKE